jgi:hypothetical protein
MPVGEIETNGFDGDHFHMVVTIPPKNLIKRVGLIPRSLLRDFKRLQAVDTS